MKMSMYRALCGVGAGIILLGGLAGCGKKPEGGAGDVGPTSAVVSVNDSAPVVSGVEDDVEVVAEVATADDVSGKSGVWAGGVGYFCTFPGSTIPRSFTDYMAVVAPMFFNSRHVDSDRGYFYNNAWVVNADNSYSVKPRLCNYLSSSDYGKFFQYGDAYVSLEEAVVGFHPNLIVSAGAVTDDVVYAGLGDLLCVNGGAEDLSSPCYLGYLVMAVYASGGTFDGFTDAGGSVPYGLFSRAVTVGDLAVILYGDSLGGDLSIISDADDVIAVLNSSDYSELVSTAYEAVCASSDYAFLGGTSPDTVLSCMDVDRILFRAVAGDHASRIDSVDVVEAGISAYYGADAQLNVEGLNHPELGNMSEEDLNAWVVEHYMELDESYFEDLDKIDAARVAAKLSAVDYSGVAADVVNLK